MIVVCPSCAAHYEIDREVFGLSARVVHCSACDHEWEAVPGELEPVAAEDDGAWDEGQAGGGSTGGASGLTESGDLLGVSHDRLSGLSESVPIFSDDGPEPEKNGRGNGGFPADESPSAATGEVDFPPQEALVFSEADEGGPALPEGAGAAGEEWPSPAVDDDGETAPPPPPERSRRLKMVTAAAAAAVVLAVIVLIAAAGPISHALPGAAAIYSNFGLAAAPPGAGLDIRDVTSSREWTGSEDVLVVAGTVANVATGPRGLPPLRVTLFDADRSEVQAVVVQPGRPTLAEGESIPFVARIPSPAITARRAVVSFQPAVAERG